LHFTHYKAVLDTSEKESHLTQRPRGLNGGIGAGTIGLVVEFNLNAVRTHVDYSNWASNRLVTAASTLPPEEPAGDFGTADRSVLGTLVHIYTVLRSHSMPGLGQAALWAGAGHAGRKP
jgi:hypothetical protein